MACNMKHTIVSTHTLPGSSRGKGEKRVGKGKSSMAVHFVADDRTTLTLKSMPESLAERVRKSTPLMTERKRAPTKVDMERKEMSTGKFGIFGGKFVPETLIVSLSHLEAEFNLLLRDDEFQEELAMALRDYVGRETPLYYAQRLTEHYKNGSGEGPEIYLKREDLNHCGGYTMNNAIAQAMMAKRMGRKCVVTATGSGQHGIATAASCAKLALDCTIFMGSSDMAMKSSSVLLMKQLGAQVTHVDGTFKDAVSESIRHWVGNLEKSYYLMGAAVGPHPCPAIVREFQSVIGKETRKQAMEKWGARPDVLVACVGTGSNALGLFHEFVEDEDVRLIGVEAGGCGLDSGKHSATLVKGEVGVYHGALSYLLQDEDGQIAKPHSIGIGLRYPGVSPELSFLRDSGRAQFFAVTDKEALQAYDRLCQLEGIFPSLETSHALAILGTLAPKLHNGCKVVINCSGRGDGDSALTCQMQKREKHAT